MAMKYIVGLSKDEKAELALRQELSGTYLVLRHSFTAGQSPDADTPNALVIF